MNGNYKEKRKFIVKDKQTQKILKSTNLREFFILLAKKEHFVNCFQKIFKHSIEK